MQAHGSVASGGCGGNGPDLTRPVPLHAPPLAPVRRAASTSSHITVADQRRNDAARNARAALAAVGKRWRDAREWGLEQDRWMPADCPTHTINPAVTEAYLAYLKAADSTHE